MRQIKTKYLKPLLEREEYFARWTPKELEPLTENIKEQIYQEHYAKHIVFNRDNHECQVDGCGFDNSPLTLHHYKHKSNGGKTTPRNCITICQAHQNKYHSGKKPMKFKDREELPSHIAGHTQAHDWYAQGRPRPEFAYKHMKKEMRVLRKNNKEYWGRPITFERFLILFAWLFGIKISQGL